MVADGAFEHIGNGLDAAMRVGGEPADGSLDGVVESEMVEKQKWVEFVGRMRTKGTPEQYARAFDDKLGFDYVGDTSKVCHAV